MPSPTEFSARCNELLELAGSIGIGALTPNERLAYEVNRFLVEYESGGLTGLLYNINRSDGQTSWSELTAIATSLRQLGCHASANELASLEPALVAACQSISGTWGEFCGAVGQEQLSQADQVLGQQVAEIWEHLERFVVSLPNHGQLRDGVA